MTHRFLLRNGDELKLSSKGVEVGLVRHPLDTLKGASARVLSRGMSIETPGGALRLEFFDRKSREAAMEALAKLLGGRVLRKGRSPWATLELGPEKS